MAGMRWTAYAARSRFTTGIGQGRSDDGDRAYPGGFRPTRGCQGLRVPRCRPWLHDYDARPRLYRIGARPAWARALEVLRSLQA
jgi:hypothetical protein